LLYENQPCFWAMQIQMSYTTNNGATLGFEERLSRSMHKSWGMVIETPQKRSSNM